MVGDDFEHRLPGRRLDSSEDCGWSSVLARTYEEPSRVEEFTTVPSPDFLVVLHLRGDHHLERREGGRWIGASFRAGSMGSIVPGSSLTLRWRGRTTTRAHSLHLHLDPGLVRSVGEDVTTPSVARRLPEGLDVDDLVARAVARGLAACLSERADTLSADSLALALVTRMVTVAEGTRAGRRDPSRAALGETTVKRVVDYMTDNMAGRVTLDELAAVATMSKYHFVRTFAAATGVPPYRYLTQLRVEHAIRLLSTTELSRQQIAVSAATGRARSSGRRSGARRANRRRRSAHPGRARTREHHDAFGYCRYCSTAHAIMCD